MKHLLLLVLAGCIYSSARAQSTGTPTDQQSAYGSMQFNKPIYDLEDHWVAFPKNEKTGKYPFGFIYLDMMAGFTFNLEGNFSLDAQGHVYRDSTDYIKTAMYKVRLGPNTKLVYAITDNMRTDLKVKPVPDWLAVYKHGSSDKNSVATNVQIGKHLNSVGGAQKALGYLESAYKTEPHATGLEFELTYSYNELKQYDKAITILNAAIANAPTNPMFYRELGYAYTKNIDFDNAIIAYTKGIDIAKQRNPEARMEMVQNLSLVYCQLKQFDKAVTLINNAIADAPDNISLYILEATTYLKGSDPDNAIKAYTTAIDIAKPNQLEQKAELAWAIAIIYRDQKKDMILYGTWGKKAKDWAPANSKAAQALRNVVL